MFLPFPVDVIGSSLRQYLSLTEEFWSMLCPYACLAQDTASFSQTAADRYLSDLFLRAEVMLVPKIPRETNLLFSIHTIYKCSYS